MGLQDMGGFFLPQPNWYVAGSVLCLQVQSVTRQGTYSLQAHTHVHACNTLSQPYGPARGQKCPYGAHLNTEDTCENLTTADGLLPFFPAGCLGVANAHKAGLSTGAFWTLSIQSLAQTSASSSCWYLDLQALRFAASQSSG